jgi:glycosyltransferase involved in cell wall biosynthesis
MKLSIVVPVYGVENTLDRCLESIVSQTYTDIEVILVDDGSPDLCPQMCDEWAGKDQRIHVIHKENGGLSDARNAGIEAAKGELITFVDSDDFIQQDTYQQVVPLCEHHDIVEYPVNRFFGSPRQSLLSFIDETFTDKETYWLKRKGYEHTYAWNKIYKRALFHDIRFPKGRIFEDADTFPQLLQRANSIATTSKGLYYYCQNDQGITATAQGSGLENLLESHLKTMQVWCDDIYYLHILNIQMDVYELTGKSPILPQRHVSPIYRGMNMLQRAKASLLILLGIKRLCKFNKLIHQWKIRH